MDYELTELAHQLAEIRAVEGSVIVASDGVVLAEAMEGDAEKEGAVAVFVGNAANQVGQALALGPLDWGVVIMSDYRMLILQQPDFFVGLLLAEKASPALVALQAEEALAVLD